MKLVCFAHAGALIDPFRDLDRCCKTCTGQRSFICAIDGKEQIDADSYLNVLFQKYPEAFCGPVIFAGHSAGGHLALRAAALAPTETIVLTVLVSSSVSLEFDQGTRPSANDSDAKLVAFLKRLGGTPTEILQDAKACSFLLSTLRHDLTIMESGKDLAPETLSVPVFELWGSNEPERLAAPYWAAVTSGTHRQISYDGGHFHLYDHLEEFAALIDSFFETHKKIREMLHHE